VTVAADVLLVHGRILTMDPADSVREAVAVRGQRVQALGRDGDLRALAGPSTRVIDLRGKTVIPGIVDAHAHMDREGLKNLYPGLEGVRSIADVLAVIRREAAGRPPGEWVVTMPIGDRPNYTGVPGSLAERRYPDRRDLDAVAPDHPVYIRGIWPAWNVPPSVSVANSRALALAGVTRETRSPDPSVEIERDATGEPTGVIVDRNAYPIVEHTLMRVVPRFMPADRVRALRESMRLYNGVGTTSVCESHGVAEEVLRAYKVLWDAQQMTVRARLVLSPAWTPASDAASEMARLALLFAGPGFGDDMLRVGGVFIQLGGEPHVARACADALPFTGWAGFVVTHISPPRFRELVGLAAQHEIRVYTVAPARDELEEVLDVFEAVNKEHPLGGRRWALVHARDVDPDQIARLVRLGVVCETIPLTHLWLRGARYVRDPAQAARAVPHVDFLRSGLRFALGTDNKPYNPFQTLWAAVTREERESGTCVGPEQRLTRQQALRAFTIDGAFFAGEEAVKGSLEPGKLADLAVLTADPLEGPDDDLRHVRAHLTMVGGRIVHDDGVIAS
jgi:predicted amidohydrolase YtcJ